MLRQPTPIDVSSMLSQWGKAQPDACHADCPSPEDLSKWLMPMGNCIDCALATIKLTVGERRAL
jgi:hypothetical protein